MYITPPNPSLLCLTPHEVFPFIQASATLQQYNLQSSNPDDEEKKIRDLALEDTKYREASQGLQVLCNSVLEQCKAMHGKAKNPRILIDKETTPLEPAFLGAELVTILATNPCDAGCFATVQDILRIRQQQLMPGAWFYINLGAQISFSEIKSCYPHIQFGSNRKARMAAAKNIPYDMWYYFVQSDMNPLKIHYDYTQFGNGDFSLLPDPGEEITFSIPVSIDSTQIKTSIKKYPLIITRSEDGKLIMLKIGPIEKGVGTDRAKAIIKYLLYLAHNATMERQQHFEAQSEADFNEWDYERPTGIHTTPIKKNSTQVIWKQLQTKLSEQWNKQILPWLIGTINIMLGLDEDGNIPATNTYNDTASEPKTEGMSDIFSNLETSDNTPGFGWERLKEREQEWAAK